MLKASRTVVTKYGAVVGSRLLDSPAVDAFWGVPYAAPPVGERRLTRPIAPAPWSGVRECLSFGNRAIQQDGHGRPTKVPTSEDCLFLNVFAPAWEKKLEEKTRGYPVMVFIHGGAFISGSTVSYGDRGVSEHLVSRGLVVVTIQYRLGWLGFFSSGDDRIEDNLGLWDQRAALLWIKENIACFGGDPGNVTVVGKSAGAVSADLLAISPESRDLFHKAVCLSGTADCDWAIKDTVASCREFAERNGVDWERDDLLSQLQSLDASVFADSFFSIKDWKTPDVPLAPRLSGPFLPKDLDELRKETNREFPKQWIIGAGELEALIIMSPDDWLLSADEMLYHHIPDEKKRAEIADMVRLSSQKSGKPSKERELAEVLSDVFMNIGVQKTVRKLAEEGQKVYFFSFDYTNPELGELRDEWPVKAASHCTDTAYLLDRTFRPNRPFNQNDIRMRTRMCDWWERFAASGNPNGGEGVWRATEPSNPQSHLSIDGVGEAGACMSVYFHDGRPHKWSE